HKRTPLHERRLTDRSASTCPHFRARCLGVEHFRRQACSVCLEISVTDTLSSALHSILSCGDRTSIHRRLLSHHTQSPRDFDDARATMRTRNPRELPPFQKLAPLVAGLRGTLAQRSLCPASNMRFDIRLRRIFTKRPHRDRSESLALVPTWLRA